MTRHENEQPSERKEIVRNLIEIEKTNRIIRFVDVFFFCISIERMSNIDKTDVYHLSL